MWASKISPPGQEGWLRHKEKAAFLAGAAGVVDQAPKSIRSAARALTYLPPRRSRSKTIARVCPSCPGGEILLCHTLSLRLVGRALEPGCSSFSVFDDERGFGFDGRALPRDIR